MQLVLVSVIIPTYNRAHSVGRSIESVLRQTYGRIEVIVVDDGSTDDIAGALVPYGDLIHVINQSNGGPSSARNTGVANAKGEIVAFLDSDDTWHPEKLERQMKLLTLGGSSVPCCVCNARNMIDGVFTETSFGIAGVDCELAEGYWLNPTDLIATRFLLFNQVVAIRRCAFEKVGGFKNHLRLLEDHDLAFRLSLLGPWAFISETLVTKYDEADGVGVQARRDPIVHLNASMTAIRGFLSEPIKPGGNVELQIQKSLRDGNIEIRAITMINNGGGVLRLIGCLLKFSLRIRRGIRRRMPSWPQPKAVRNLHSEAFDDIKLIEF